MKIIRFIIIMSIVCLQLFAQKKENEKKELTSAKKKNEIIFSNDKDRGFSVS